MPVGSQALTRVLLANAANFAAADVADEFGDQLALSLGSHTNG
jgi:hypothetical protein